MHADGFTSIMPISKYVLISLHSSCAWYFFQHHNKYNFTVEFSHINSGVNTTIYNSGTL